MPRVARRPTVTSLTDVRRTLPGSPTLAVLAARAGVSVSTLCRIETGGSTFPHRVGAIARAYGLAVEDLEDWLARSR